MKFKSLFDYRYFVHGVIDSVKDENLKARLKASGVTEIKDEDYFLLTDGVESFLGEVKYYSKGKTFYRGLKGDSLGFENLSNLYALMTHLSIGLKDRVSVRDGVDYRAFLELRSTVDGLVSGILKDGSVENKLKNLL